MLIEVLYSFLGMVYMSSSALDWSPIMKGWLNLRAAHERDIIFAMFETAFPPIFRYAIQNLVFKMEVLEAFIITQVGVNVFLFVIQTNLC